MYCKHCGKVIADDSKFCQHCGGKIDTPILESKEEASIEKPAEEDNTTPKIVIKTNDDSAIQVELTKKSTDNSSTIANEIVGNLKMVGIASIFWVVYVIGFIVVHQKDIEPISESSRWGASYYDPKVLTSQQITTWEEEFYRKVQYATDSSKIKTKKVTRTSPIGLKGLSGVNKTDEKEFTEEDLFKALDNWDDDSWYYNDLKTIGKDVEFSTGYDLGSSKEEEKNEDDTNETLMRANQIAKRKMLSDAYVEQLKEEAKREVERKKEELRGAITEHRNREFEKDLNNHMLWCAIIALSIFILGRYLIKLTEWVDKNTTEP